jgi:bifunctional DNA-binding transcriptional regulator/antitoxin component of YhaV-PrlF toxin-antitoxin module
MLLINLLPKLIEHKVPVSTLNINRRVFFHWKKEGIIDYEPYIIEKENINDEESKPVKKWLHLNAFDMLWLLMVKELRNLNVDLKTIKKLKTYLDTSIFNSGKENFSQIPEENFYEQIKAQKKLMLPMDESNEIMESILNDVTPKKLDDFVFQLPNEVRPFMNILGSTFSSVVLYNINPILLIKKKIGSDDINFEMKFPELQAEIDSLKFANELTNILNKEIVFSLPIRPFFEFIFTDDKYFKYCVDFELFDTKEKELLEIIKSDDYKEIIISRANNGALTIRSSYEKEVKEEKAKEIKKLLGLNQYEKAEVIFRNDKHLIINKTVTKKI